MTAPTKERIHTTEATAASGRGSDFVLRELTSHEEIELLAGASAMLTQDSSGGVGSGGGSDPMNHMLADSGERTLKTCSIRAGQGDSGRGRQVLTHPAGSPVSAPSSMIW